MWQGRRSTQDRPCARMLCKLPSPGSTRCSARTMRAMPNQAIFQSLQDYRLSTPPRAAHVPTPRQTMQLLPIEHCHSQMLGCIAAQGTMPQACPRGRCVRWLANTWQPMPRRNCWEERTVGIRARRQSSPGAQLCLSKSIRIRAHTLLLVAGTPGSRNLAASGWSPAR
jgi:hypothetical protein